LPYLKHTGKDKGLISVSAVTIYTEKDPIMKQLLIAVLLLSCCSHLYGQDADKTVMRFRGGLVAGLNASQVDGDDYAGYHKLGLNAGFLSQVPLSKKFFMSVEILYAQKGAKSKTFQGYPTAYQLNLHYAEVPILINFQEKSAVNFGLGVSYGRLVKSKEFVDELEQPTSDDFKRNDISAIANGTYLISDHFQLNVRFAYSIVPIGYRDGSNFNNRGMYNNVLSFRLAYVL